MYSLNKMIFKFSEISENAVEKCVVVGQVQTSSFTWKGWNKEGMLVVKMDRTINQQKENERQIYQPESEIRGSCISLYQIP